ATPQPQPQPPPSTIGSATPTSTAPTAASSGLVPGLISLLPGALSLKSSAGTGAVCPTSMCTSSGGGRSNGAQAALGRGLNGSLRGTPTTQKTGLYAGGTAVSTSASSSSSSAVGTNRVPYGRPPVQLLAQQPHFGSSAVASVPSGTQPTISPVAFNNAPAPNTSTSNY
ncbi:unnamed protein product, partial [Anisakis simplex]|uniref:Ubinuclein 1 n=1 Tax=Anisakis simplex TaxID=6269 RepID=A0A0M3JK54_ANISI